MARLLTTKQPNGNNAIGFPEYKRCERNEQVESARDKKDERGKNGAKPEYRQGIVLPRFQNNRQADLMGYEVPISK